MVALKGICLLFLTLHCVVIKSSIIKFNQTQFAKLPVLFALDNWDLCEADHGVYCTVDAKLVADGPSEELELLKEYSKQTLKHYNRTLIHRGVCVTHCLPHAAWRDASEAQRNAAVTQCVSRTLAHDGLQAEVISIQGCTLAGSRDLPPEGRALAIGCMVLLVLVTLATGIHLVADKWGKTKGSKYLYAFSLKQSWAILTYDRSKPRTDTRMGDLACLEGIRVLAIQCVIFSHVLFIYIYGYTDNPNYVEKMYDQVPWQTMLNSPLWLQAFFSLSSFLMVYPLLISVSERKPFTLGKAAVSVFTRWVRLTPLAVFSLWFTMWILPSLGSGPQWWSTVTREADECSERWLWHVSYLHNHLPTGKFCMGHTWYLAVDMQLHIFGVILMLVLVRWRQLVWSTLALLLMASAVIPGVLAYCHELMPIITVQSPESLRNLFAGATTLPQLYLPSYMNLAGYSCGVACAFILHHLHTGAVQLQESKVWIIEVVIELCNCVFTLLFHLSLLLGSAVVMTGTIFLGDNPQPLWATTLYAALDRTLVAVCFNIFMLGCIVKCPSALRSMFEWRGFHPLGRLSYPVFLVHFIVLRLQVAGDPRLLHVSVANCISLLVIVSITSYIASLPLCLMIEIPFCQLWKAVTERDSLVTDHQATSPSPRSDRMKNLDLVAHVRSTYNNNRV